MSKNVFVFRGKQIDICCETCIKKLKCKIRTFCLHNDFGNWIPKNVECNACRLSWKNTESGSNECIEACTTASMRYWKPCYRYVIEKENTPHILDKYELTEGYKKGISIIDLMKSQPCKNETLAMIEAVDNQYAQLKQLKDFKGYSFIKKRDNIEWAVKEGFIQPKRVLKDCPKCGNLMKLFTENEWENEWEDENIGRTQILLGCDIDEGCGLSSGRFANCNKQELLDYWGYK